MAGDWGVRLARLQLLARERKGQGGTKAQPVLPGTEIAPGLLRIERQLGALCTQLHRLDLPEELAPPWHTEAPVERKRLLFFDTETTGLSGGAGLTVFMLGLLRWQADGWCLRQYLMTRPGAAAALCDALTAECRGDEVLVSYNGKGFDVPALRNQALLHGRADALAGLAHWDLLYPVRRLFRTHWPNCRLQTVEQRLLGVWRRDDLPGSEAPRAWRDYLRCGDSADLLRVLGHNRLDLETLLRLLRELSRPAALVANSLPQRIAK